MYLIFTLLEFTNVVSYHEASHSSLYQVEDCESEPKS